MAIPDVLIGAGNKNARSIAFDIEGNSGMDRGDLADLHAGN